jgi:hypothetical protein
MCEVDTFAQGVIANTRVSTEVQVQETFMQMNQPAVIDLAAVAIGKVQSSQTVKSLQRFVGHAVVHR